MTHFVRRITYRLTAALAGLLLSQAVHSADMGPLRPVDASGPRATLQGFVETVDELYSGTKNVLREYEASQRLYLTANER